jgi:hypothetical protein
MHIYPCDVMKEATQGNQCDDFELLPNKLCHRFRKNNNEQKDLVHQDKTKGRIDRLQIIVVVPPIEGGNVIKKKEKDQVADKKYYSEANYRYLKPTSIARGDVGIKSFGKRSSV